LAGPVQVGPVTAPRTDVDARPRRQQVPGFARQAQHLGCVGRGYLASQTGVGTGLTCLAGGIGEQIQRRAGGQTLVSLEIVSRKAGEAAAGVGAGGAGGYTGAAGIAGGDGVAPRWTGQIAPSAV
jgi:hypothetical protein